MMESPHLAQRHVARDQRRPFRDIRRAAVLQMPETALSPPGDEKANSC
jgi:hypothetical protein